MKKKSYPKLKKYPDGGTKPPPAYNPSFDYDSYYKDLNQFKTIPLNKKTGLIDTPKSLNPYLPALSGNLKAQQATMDAYMQANKLKSLTPQQANEALTKANMGSYNDNYLKNAKAWEDYRNKTIVQGQELDTTTELLPDVKRYGATPGGTGNVYSYQETTPYDSTHSQRMFPKNTVTNIQPHAYGGYQQLPKYENGAETTSMMAEYGVDNPDLYNPSDPNRGKNTGQYMQYGMAAANTLGQVQATNQDASLNSTQKAQAQSGAINQGVDQVAGQALPWYGMAMGASNIGRNMIKKDAEGKPANSNARATDALMKPIHQQQIDAATNGNWGDFIGSTLGGGLYAPIRAKLDKNYQYPMGGTNMQPNAEVEKQEIMRMPDGSTEQVDGPSHENGGVPVNIPTGTQIFSDRLKHPETGKTFAKEAAKYKIKGTDLSPTQKLINSVRQKKLDQIFKAQEDLKQSKITNYATKLGVDINSMMQKAPANLSKGIEGKTINYPYGGPVVNEKEYIPEGWDDQPISLDRLPMNTSNAAPDQMQLKTVAPMDYSNLGTAEEQSSSNPNLRDNLGLGANILGQNVGNIADLYMTKFGKKYDKENSGQLTSAKLDPTQALIDADIQNRITRGALAGAANGNAGAYMSNAIQAGATNTVNKAGIRQKYDAANTQIANADLYHNQATRIQDKMNEQQNKARSEDIARTAIRGAGTNTAAAISDFKKGKMDKYALDLISKAYPDYTYDEKSRTWKHKVSGKKLEATQ